jgi:hypothetical protein
MKRFVLALLALSLPGLAVADPVSAGGTEVQGPKKNLFISHGDRDRSIVVVHVDGARSFYAAQANTNVARGKALQIAKAAAVSGDTIIVGPGNYKITSSLAKNGVNWQFMAGASVTRTDETEGAVWDDRNTPMSFSVIGYGDFTRITTSDLARSLVVRVRHPSSVISIQGRDFTALGPVAGRIDASVLRLEDGRVVLEGRNLNARANRNGYTLWWFNGSGVVRAARVTGDYVSVGGSVDKPPTGDFHVTAEELETAIFSSTTQPTAAMWIRCNILRDVLSDGGAVSITGSGKIYIDTLKAFGFIYLTEWKGLLYLNAEKHTATINGADDLFNFLNVDGGEVYYRVRHIDPNGFGGASFGVTGGTLQWDAGTLKGSATTKGLSISGGTARLNGVTLDTATNGATSPVMKSGGTLILNGGTALVAEGRAPSISAASPQDVKVYGNAVTNCAPTSNVTIQVGTLTVDPGVE